MKRIGTPLEQRRARIEVEGGEKRRRVGNVAASFMIGLALLFDLLQFLLVFLIVADVFIAALAYIAFYIVWFPLLKVSLSKGKPMKLVNVLVSGVIEALPLFDLLPGITYGVVSTIVLSRVEDAVYNKAHAREIKESQARREKESERDARDQAALEAQVELEAANDNEALEESAQEAA